jgi:hypothetical protein
MTEKPMGIFQRTKAAAGVLIKGKLPNPLAGEPKDRSRAALVTELTNWCVEERKFWKPVFDRIRQEQNFAAGKQWEGSLKDTKPDTEEYIGDMVQQLVNRKTASLYAKNPTPEAQLKERLNFELWDGDQRTIDNCKALVASIAPQALQAHEAAAAGQDVPPPPDQMTQDLQEAEAIMQDYAAGMAEKAMLEKISKTGTLLIKQQWGAQSPNMLINAKQAVTRVITSRVAFVKVMYKRDMQTVPTETANTVEFSEKLASLKAQLKELEENTSEDSANIEQVRLLKQSLTEQISAMPTTEEVPSEEGIVLDWLSATSVIVDRRCKALKEFIGAHRIAHELLMTVDECEKKFGVSLRDSGAKFYTETRDGWTSEERTDMQDASGNVDHLSPKQKVCVWNIEDKDTGLSYVVCDGVKDFLQEPHTNEPEVNRFWSIVAVTFNAQEVESNQPEFDCTIYPRSDVRLMMPMQVNVNVAGQEKRKHRAANRPAWVGVKSKFASTAGTNDLQKLAAPRAGHDVLMMENLNDGEKIADFIQPLPKQPFDQWLYDNGQDSQAMMLATGQQASDIGEQRPDEKATGQNIAAQARASSEASNIDDLNFLFTTLAQMSWEMLVQEMPQDVVKKLVGKGAVWPDLPSTRQNVAESIFFQIEAGSMGRPNQQAEMQKLQILDKPMRETLAAMGKSPEPWLKYLVRVMDANVDVDEFMKDAQVIAPPSPQQEQQRPPSVSISANLKDLPPEEQNQAVAKFYGLQPASPHSTLLNKIGHGSAVGAHHANNQPAAPADVSAQ